MPARFRNPAATASAGRQASGGRGHLLLRLLTAAMLGVDAYVHVHDHGYYAGSRGGAISQATLFLLEALVAAVAAVVLIVGWRLRVPRRADWIVAFLVATSALSAVVLFRYVDVGAFGPLPNMYEPTWETPGKLLSAYAEAAAALLSAVGLAIPGPGSARRRGRLGTRARPLRTPAPEAGPGPVTTAAAPY